MAGAVIVPLVAFGGLTAASAGVFTGPASPKQTAGTGGAVREQEPATVRGRNDTPGTGQHLTQVGTTAGKARQVQVNGALADPAPPTAFWAVAEDNGSITLAADIKLTAGERLRTTGTIGDGPHGSAGDRTGDVDVYAVRATTAGQVLSVEVATTGSALQSAVLVWDAKGQALTVDDDRLDNGFASRPDPEAPAGDEGTPVGPDTHLLTAPLPTVGDYYVAVLAAGAIPKDPFTSGSTDGVKSEGMYTVTFGLDAGDVDVYAVTLTAGDVLSATVSGAATFAQVFDRSKKLAISSTGASTSQTYFPKISPLAKGGNADLNHIAARDGRYYVAVSSGSGAYELTIRTDRPGPETQKATQTIFLDFDGASIDPTIIPDNDDDENTGIRTLSPLSAFITQWGLRKNQSNALIDQIVATVKENLQGDFAGESSKVTILNSRDDSDPFGEPHVSRLIIGGTEQESGISNLAYSQSQDPGNFAMEETGGVQLDLLAAPAGDDFSINTYLTAKSNRLQFVGTAIGIYASHEAGHFLGLSHAFEAGTPPDLMSPGLEQPNVLGLGPDKIGGTADDIDVDYRATAHAPSLEYRGPQDGHTRIRWALP